MKRAVSVSLGSSRRDKDVLVRFGDEDVRVQRIGTDGDESRARALFAELDQDDEVGALGLGGFELYVRVGDTRYPLRSGHRLVRDVRSTPVVDGGGLKQTLERRVFELAAPALGGAQRFRRALVLVGSDRFGMSEAVAEVAGEVVFADLYYGLGFPLRLRSLAAVRRVAAVLLPVVRFLPVSMLYPVGEKQEQGTPRYRHLWRDADLIAGDFHYIRTNMPDDLRGRTILTNTTTEADIDLLRARGVRTLITTTPRYEGRSFGTNLLEAALTAWAGKGRELTNDELDPLIDRLDLRPHVEHL